MEDEPQELPEAPPVPARSWDDQPTGEYQRPPGRAVWRIRWSIIAAVTFILAVVFYGFARGR